jgi:hypothetical protein
MFYYIHEWYKWFNSFSNGIKKDQVAPESKATSGESNATSGESNATSGEIPFEEPLPIQRIEKSEIELIKDIIPFEEPLPKQRIYSTGRKYK